MKTLLSTIIAFLSFIIIPFSISAQCPDNFYPNNQAELEAFLTNYPNCTMFPGDIRLDEDDIDDLTPLQNLTSIGGYLEIRFTQLTSLEGLENLTSVGEIFSIYDNDQLPDLDGLSNLSSVGHLDIQHNNLLTEANLSGLQSTGGIFIGNNPLLSIINLSSLNSVPENVHITSNDKLTSLQGLNNISTIGGYLHISGNQALTSLNLNSLSSIERYLIISTNPKITSLQGLGNLSSLGEGFQVTSNTMLTSLEGLGTFTSIGGALQIINNDMLTSLQPLSNISSIQGELQIENNAQLSSLQGLENIAIENITHLYLAQNPILTVCDLPNICNYLSFDILDNPRTIFGNAAGCESVMAVQVSCMPEEVFAVSVEALENITVECSTLPQELNLPSSVEVNFSDVTTRNVAVTWDLSAYDGTVGSHPLTGTLDLTTEENPDNLMASITVITEDSQGPVPDNESLADITAQCEVTENDVTPPTATDNCTQATITASTDFAFPTSEDGTITWTFEDDAGNTSTQTQNIVIQDNQAPVPDTETLPHITAQCEVTENDVTPPTATDNCTEGSITASTNFAFPTAEGGMITWTFEDDAGNTSTQTQEIVIESSALPVIECAESHIINCDSFVTFDLPIATSECGSVSLIQTDGTGLTSGSVFPIGTTTLSYKASNSSGTATCKIEIEVLPPLEIHHASGVGYGDTLHVADCLPPDHSKANLDLGVHQNRSSLSGSIYKRELPPNPEFGLWKISLFTYSVKDQCGNSDYFENYVALYDLKPPEYRNFPPDTTIDSPADLPPVPEDVRIIDICRYVVWDTVTTTPVLHPGTNDSLAFIHRWMAEDEVGNKSFRDQIIHVKSTPEPDLNNIIAHITREEDLIEERFPSTAGVDLIPVTLYKQQPDHSFIPVDTMVTGNWMGRRGNLFFTSLLPGKYVVQIRLPGGYSAIDPDSLIFENGWSDTLSVAGDSTLDLGTILLVPDRITDTSLALPGFVELAVSARSESKKLRIYPNPTSGRMKFELPDRGVFDYTIFNHLGQPVLNGQIENGAEINLRNQTNGMYFIIIKDEEKFIGTRRIAVLSDS